MQLTIRARLDYAFPHPTDLLLQLEAAANIGEQRVDRAHIAVPDCEHFVRIAGHDGIGDRIWIRTRERLTVDYTASLTILRQLAEIERLAMVPPHLLPGETVQYLLDSLYCPASRFQNFVEAEFGGLAGGARIAAMRDWIEHSFRYSPGSSDSTTTALDSFVARQGVCRDYAHVLIALARASAIPARFASVYAPDVRPQDFHAVAEVFLADGLGGGVWHLIDPTGMAAAGAMVKIGIGRDAADVSFMTVFGTTTMVEQAVDVQRT
jgi:transglutaminase-like putative cysteine protease